MFVHYSFVENRRNLPLKAEPIILTASLAVVAGIGAMIAATLAFIMA